MLVQTRKLAGVLFTVAALMWSCPAALADSVWRVTKSSGEVWMLRGEAQLVALGTESTLGPGDNIRTGRNGRVLLTRGEERILIAPNSAIGLPLESKNTSGTTITQQAGSILLEVEKKNVPHFEVETPYLAAVVKGTQFRVSVNRGDAHVDVLQGQVQVSDFKSGQQIVLLPGQAAKVSASGPGGLVLSGKGRFNAIEQGKPRVPALRALSIPKGGLRAPNLGSSGNAVASGPAQGVDGKTRAVHLPSNGAVRIGMALGEVKLDYRKVTKGLARAPGEIASAVAKRAGTAGNAYAAADARGKASGDSGSAATGNSATSSGNGLALGLGNGSGSGSSNGLALAMGNGNGSGSGLSVGTGNGNGGGLSVGTGNGNGGGLSVGIGNGGGNGLSVGIGNGNGLALGLTNGNGNGAVLGLGKTK
jgi:hypothetical protein